ncbi:hypothetical protein OIU78_024870 [Salix suchowensis]|nr:hypothetical protein OIU78_024870 [Salix suchowensis]
MEALYLLFSILSTFFTSITLSILLVIRTFLTRRPSSTISSNAVSLYQGTVWHERRRPVHHSFRYSVRYALFDLDQTHAPPDHLSADDARQVAQTTGPVFLLTIPPSVGYEQNPLSLYYCYDMDGSARVLKKCIAEVTNTPWGERVVFVFIQTQMQWQNHCMSALLWICWGVGISKQMIPQKVYLCLFQFSTLSLVTILWPH